MAAAAPLTDLIRRVQDGDPQALRHLFDATYEDLRSVARSRLNRSGRGPLLDTSALEHESFLRFANAGQLRLDDRQHFMKYTSQVMRSVVVDLVRSNLAERRGGGAPHLPIDTSIRDALPESAGELEIMRVHEALEELSALNPRMAQIVEMRYFGGMTEAEVAEAMGLGERTVRRDWEKARLILADALSPER
jgi:RNA polymerase sigma factor (TIGR02999 family)